MYLSVNGIDEYIKATLTFDELLIDMKPIFTGGNQTYYDARNGLPDSYFSRFSNGTDTYGPGVSAVYKDGVLIANGVDGNFSNNVRVLIRSIFNAPGTDDINIYSNRTNANCMSADVYDIKFYNGGTLVAHYDMNTGTVLDQSGNGNDAILSGGTWVAEGGPTVVDAGVIGLSASAILLSQASKLAIGNSTIQATSSLDSAGTKVNNGQSGLIANSSLSALANRIINSTSTMNANSSLSAEGEILSLQVSASLSASATMGAIGNRIRESDTALSANSLFTADGEAITFEITANLSASSQMTANGTLLKSGESTLSANGNMLATGTVIYDGESVFFASSELSALLGETSILIGTVQLEGSKELNIYLQASKELEVTLQANKELYVNLKGVMN